MSKKPRNDAYPSPLAVDITAAREAAGLTQTEAANIIKASQQAWQHWEAGDREMHPAFWDLFKIKIARNLR